MILQYVSQRIRQSRVVKRVKSRPTEMRTDMNGHTKFGDSAYSYSSPPRELINSHWIQVSRNTKKNHQLSELKQNQNRIISYTEVDRVLIHSVVTGNCVGLHGYPALKWQDLYNI